MPKFLGGFFMNTVPIMAVLGILTAIAATVLIYIFFLPESKRERLPKIGKLLHDIFNFKSLFIEKVLQLLYILSTTSCIFIGFFMLFGFEESWYRGVNWYGGYGILIMLLGPIAIRIAFEAAMLFILLVKNVIQINNKLKSNIEHNDQFKNF